MDSNKLYQYFLIVKLSADKEKESNLPKCILKYYFPEGEIHKTDQSLLKNQVPLFCFPDATTFPKRKFKKDEKFLSFALTDVSGTKRFGYCFRDFPRLKVTSGVSNIHSTGITKQWPRAYCFITQLPFLNLFEEILLVLAGLSHDFSDIKSTLGQLMNTAPPGPGREIRVMLGTSKDWTLRNASSDENVFGFENFAKLFGCLDPVNVSTIFISLLLERRLIFYSSKVSLLGDCVQAVVSLLYPFNWQHVFIPILPPSMIDVVCAPVPFVVGVLATPLSGDLSTDSHEHRDHFQMLSHLPIEEDVVLVDLDHNLISRSTDIALLPPKWLKFLIHYFGIARNIVRRHENTNKRPNLKIMEKGILLFMSSLLRGFTSHITPNDSITSKNSKDSTLFNTEEFLNSVPEERKLLLQAITGSQFWYMFLQNYKPGEDHYKHFEKYYHSEGNEIEEGIYDTDEDDIIIKEGWLTKQDPKTMAWHPRYFILTPQFLNIKKSKQEEELSQCIPLSTISNLETVKEQPNCIFLNISNELHFLLHYSTELMKYWKFSLELFIGLKCENLEEAKSKWKMKRKLSRRVSLKVIKGSIMSDRATRTRHSSSVSVDSSRSSSPFRPSYTLPRSPSPSPSPSPSLGSSHPPTDRPTIPTLQPLPTVITPQPMATPTKRKPLPPVPKRPVVISSPTSSPALRDIEKKRRSRVDNSSLSFSETEGTEEEIKKGTSESPLTTRKQLPPIPSSLGKEPKKPPSKVKSSSSVLSTKKKNE